MSRWLRDSLLAWIISSVAFGMAMAAFNDQLNSPVELIRGFAAITAVVAVLSALWTGLVAAIVYAPLRARLVRMPRSVTLSLAGLALILLFYTTSLLEDAYAEDGYRVAFWMWLCSVSAGFLGVSAFSSRSSA